VISVLKFSQRSFPSEVLRQLVVWQTAVGPQALHLNGCLCVHLKLRHK